MFNQNLIVAVKANNKVLREVKDTVYIPFGQEYKILIKNLDSRRVQVRVSIDGTDATEGTSLVINGNDEIEFERFIKNGNLNEGNKFKFIERTANIEKYRGSKAEDGIIRVEYQFEHVYTPNPYWNAGITYTNTDNSYGTVYKGSGYRDMLDGGFTTLNSVGGVARSMTASAAIASNAVFTNSSATLSAQAATATSASAEAVNDVGITVPGARSDQKFKTVAYFPVESTKHVITMKLLGESPEGKKVQAPVTVKAKPRCSTCGRVNQASAKFCSECGTSLTLF
jgi:hypothetical protein